VVGELVRAAVEIEDLAASLTPRRRDLYAATTAISNARRRWQSVAQQFPPVIVRNLDETRPDEGAVAVWQHRVQALCDPE